MASGVKSAWLAAAGRRSRVFTTPTPCMVCGNTSAVLMGTKLGADFDVTKLPVELRTPFVDGLDGICVVCGVYQQFQRYTPSQLRSYCQVLTSKDEAVGEEAFHTYPVPEDFVAGFERQHYATRLARWDQYFTSTGRDIRRALFFRPMFGAAPKFVAERFGARVAGLEISKVCQQTTQDRLPEFDFLDGNIHGMFEGEFLKTGPYDVVFVFHTLLHCIDVRESLARIYDLVAPGGAAVFSHEINRKPWNPFHMSYLSEWQLDTLLNGYFSKVDRLDRCDPAPPPSVTSFTRLGDSPDLIAIK